MYLLINPDGTVNFADDHPIREDLYFDGLELIEYPKKNLEDVVGNVQPHEAVWDKKKKRVIRDPNLPPDPESQEGKIEALEFYTRQVAKTYRSELTGFADRYKLTAWTEKSERAKRILDNTASKEDHEILQLEIDIRGQKENAKTLAKKQLEKASMLSRHLAVIEAVERNALEEIQHAPDTISQEAILARFKQHLAKAKS